VIHLHQPEPRSDREDTRRHQGATMIVVLGALVGLIAVSALAMDMGVLWGTRTQLQNAADASALAGAARLVDGSKEVVTVGDALNASVELAATNRAGSSSSLDLLPSDVVPGNWSVETETFDSSVSLLDPTLVNALQVTTRMDGLSNGPVTATFSRILGRTSFDVGATATAYVGFAGGVGPGEVELPIAIDCCKLKGANCENDYCETVTANPPNACALESPQDDGVTSVSCLQFSATEDQNACWTNFDYESPSVSANDLKQVVRDGNPTQISGSYEVYLDNGTKTNVIKETSDRFYGDGAHSAEPAGMDRYSPFDGKSDSWVTSLPVMECQTEDHCSGGATATIVGFVCFEIREVVGAPDKIIRGRFLCETDPLFEACDIGLSTTGGLDFGLRADIPVLVR
jgi:hypothetical protein